MKAAFVRYSELVAQWERGENLHITFAQWRGLKKILSHKPNRVSLADFQALLGRVGAITDKRSIRIDQLHSDKGLAWARNKRTQRDIARHNPKQWADAFVAAVENFDHYEFAGFVDSSTPFSRTHYPERRDLAPVWRIVALPNTARVSSVAYTYGSWQSNASVTVFDVRYGDIARAVA